jgi:hypothetical protein
MFFHEILIYNLTSFDARNAFVKNNNIIGGFSRPQHIKLKIKKVKEIKYIGIITENKIDEISL